MTYLNKRSILEPVAVLLPIKKDSSKLCTSNIQPLPSHNAKNPSIATPLPIEIMGSNSKLTIIETEKLKENETTQQGTIQKRDMQNSQNFTDNIKSIV